MSSDRRAYMCIYGMEGPGGYQLFGAPSRSGTPIARPTPSRGPALAAALLRPDPLLPSQRRRTGRMAARPFPKWPSRFRSGVEESTFRARRFTALFSLTMRIASAAFRSTRQAAFDTEARGVGLPRASSTGSVDLLAEMPGTRLRPSNIPRRRRPDRGTLRRKACGNCWFGPARAKWRQGEVIFGDRVDERWNAARKSPASGTIAALYITERQSLQPSAPMLGPEKKIAMPRPNASLPGAIASRRGGPAKQRRWR